jgi:hypothetical protein
MSLNLNKWVLALFFLLAVACRTADFIRPELSDSDTHPVVFLVRMNDVPAEEGVVEKLGSVFKEGGFTPVIPFFKQSFFTSGKEKQLFKADSITIRQLKIPDPITWLVLAKFRHYAIENTNGKNGLYEMSCMVEIQLFEAQSGRKVRVWKYAESGFHADFDMATQQALSNLWAHLRKKLVYELNALFP